VVRVASATAAVAVNVSDHLHDRRGQGQDGRARAGARETGRGSDRHRSVFLDSLARSSWTVGTVGGASVHEYGTFVPRVASAAIEVELTTLSS